MDLTNTDKPTLVRQALDLHPDADPSAFVMIGDREHDILGARSNRIASIGVTYGAGTPAELGEAGADHIVNSVAELRTLLLGE